MYPSSARLLLSTMSEPGFAEARAADVDEAMHQWDTLAAELASRYELSLTPLRDAYRAENVDYFRHNAWQGHVPMGTAVGAPHVLLHVDMHNTTFDELFGWQRVIDIGGAAEVRQLCGWFDVQFCAGGETPADADGNCVELSTAPYSEYTHWAHTTFVLDPPLESGSRSLTVGLTQSVRSHHDLNFTMWYGPEGHAASYSISNDFRGYDEQAGGGGGDADAGDEDVDEYPYGEGEGMDEPDYAEEE